eukprot:3229878-Rhodomonas_salina.2
MSHMTQTLHHGEAAALSQTRTHGRRDCARAWTARRRQRSQPSSSSPSPPSSPSPSAPSAPPFSARDRPRDLALTGHVTGSCHAIKRQRQVREIRLRLTVDPSALLRELFSRSNIPALARVSRLRAELMTP